MAAVASTLPNDSLAESREGLAVQLEADAASFRVHNALSQPTRASPITAACQSHLDVDEAEIEPHIRWQPFDQVARVIAEGDGRRREVPLMYVLTAETGC